MELVAIIIDYFMGGFSRGELARPMESL
jgi:hypothetical protein